MLLGCIADDFTGATDLASMLVGSGMRTVQTIGIARGHAIVADADAVVVALKTRTVPAADAIAQSLAALEWLRGSGARQLYFGGARTSQPHPARKQRPPSGVTAPSQRRFVRASRYRLPLNSKIPTSSSKHAPRLIVP